MGAIQIQIEDALQKNADELFLNTELDISTAFNLFLKEAIARGTIESDISRPIKNTTKWLEEPWHASQAPFTREENYERF